MRPRTLVALLGLCLAACGGPAHGQAGEGMLPAPATALALGGRGTEQGLDTLWATHPGGLSTITPRLEGGAAVTHTLALPGADPVAVETYGARTFILDRAAEAVLVFEGSEQRTAVQAGARPSALVVGDFNEDDQPDLAVANEGSGDVWIMLAAGETGFLPPQRIVTGTQPRALAEADFDHADGLDLAVANYASGTVSLLLGDRQGGFARGKDLAVGAGPVALLAGDVDGDQIDDVAVADALEGTLAVVSGTERLPEGAKRVPLAGGAASEPVALTGVWLPGRDSGVDVYVAERGSGTVQRVHVSADGAYGAPRTVLAITHPVALAAGAFAGDRQEDVAVADDAAHVTIVPTAGARVVAADPRALTVAAGNGAIVWSRRLGPHRYGLATARGPLVVPDSRQDPRPRIGRVKPGTPVLTRLRCGRASCTPVTSTLTGAHTRRVAIQVPAGCRVRDFALWDDDRAYVLARTPEHGCPQRAAGLWVRRGSARPRRLSRHADGLGDLRGGRVTWHETLYGGSGWRLRVKQLGSGTPVDDRQRQPRLLPARGRARSAAASSTGSRAPIPSARRSGACASPTSPPGAASTSSRPTRSRGAGTSRSTAGGRCTPTRFGVFAVDPRALEAVRVGAPPSGGAPTCGTYLSRTVA